MPAVYVKLWISKVVGDHVWRSGLEPVPTVSILCEKNAVMTWVTYVQLGHGHSYLSMS